MENLKIITDLSLTSFFLIIVTSSYSSLTLALISDSGFFRRNDKDSDYIVTYSRIFDINTTQFSCLSHLLHSCRVRFSWVSSCFLFSPLLFLGSGLEKDSQLCVEKFVSIT